MSNLPSTTLPESSLSTETPQLPVQGWAIVVMVWLTFGLTTLFNSFTLRFNSAAQRLINPDSRYGAPFALPQNMRETIGLLVGLWAGAYIAALIIGAIGSAFNKTINNRQILYSVTLGYLMAIVARLIFINVFPMTTDRFNNTYPLLPTDTYDVIHGLLTLDSIYTYHMFLVLVLIVGPMLVFLAEITGYWVGMLLNEQLTNMPTSAPFKLSEPNRYKIDPTIIINIVFLAFSIVLLVLGLLNVNDYETKMKNSPYLLHEFETVFHPLFVMGIAIFCGAVVGLGRGIRDPFAATASTFIGIALFLFLFFIFKQWMISFNIVLDENYVNELNPLIPNRLLFVSFWYLPPFLGAGTVVAVYFGINQLLERFKFRTFAPVAKK